MILSFFRRRRRKKWARTIDWSGLVEDGLIVGDPRYYSEGYAQDNEYEHAIDVAQDELAIRRAKKYGL